MTSREKFYKNFRRHNRRTPLNGLVTDSCFAEKTGTVKVDAHLWVYASRYPPDWDCTPILDEVFGDLKYAGFDKIELMQSILKHDDAVQRVNDLIHKHKLPQLAPPTLVICG